MMYSFEMKYKILSVLEDDNNLHGIIRLKFTYIISCYQKTNTKWPPTISLSENLGFWGQLRNKQCITICISVPLTRSLFLYLRLYSHLYKVTKFWYIKELLKIKMSLVRGSLLYHWFILILLKPVVFFLYFNLILTP